MHLLSEHTNYTTTHDSATAVNFTQSIYAEVGMDFLI